MAKEKSLKFSVVETTGRTFEIPLSVVKELLKNQMKTLQTGMK